MFAVKTPNARTSRLALAAALGASLALLGGGAWAQSCHPAALQADPGAAGGKTLVSFAGDYKLREKSTRTVKLVAGQSYWFAASGCPRTDDISLTVAAPDGAMVLTRTGHTTGGCVTASKTGTYKVSVMPVSLRSGYDWGSISAEGAKSDCGQRGG